MHHFILRLFTQARLTLSLIRNLAKPVVQSSSHLAVDGKKVTAFTIDGNLYFGSLRHVSSAIQEVLVSDPADIVLIKLNHLTYVDTSGIALLADLAEQLRKESKTLFLFSFREDVDAVITNSGCRDRIGDSNILRSRWSGPLHNYLFPKKEVYSRDRPAWWKTTRQSVFSIVRQSSLLNMLTDSQLEYLVSNTCVRDSGVGEILLDGSGNGMNQFVLLEGDVRIARSGGGGEKEARAVTFILDKEVRIVAVSPVRYLLLDLQLVDEILEHQEEARELASMAARNQPNVGELFKHIPQGILDKMLSRCESQLVYAGNALFKQGDSADHYYYLLEGQVATFYTDPLTDAEVHLQDIGPGTGFGEEGLLQGGVSSFSAAMLSDGRVMRLSREHFREMLQPLFVREVQVPEAQALIGQGAVLIDCRYDMEYNDGCLEGAINIPLDSIRQKIHTFDPNQQYVVYCRSGSRSKAATFILRERNINAVSVIGGITAWQDIKDH